jgi:hypothetical protein
MCHTIWNHQLISGAMTMAEYGLGRQCSICGAPIGDNNPDGIGGSCREVYTTSRMKVFFKEDSRRYKYTHEKCAPRVERFIEKLQNTKFRSPFWKQFYPSICEQWKEKGFVSKKQLDIICSRLESEVGYEEMNELYDQGKGAANDLLRFWEPSEEERQHIINLANKLRHVA